MLRYSLSLIALSASLFGATISYAQDFGPCYAEIPYLLSKGGMYTSVTKAEHDRAELTAAYTHEFGSSWTSYKVDWDKFPTPEERGVEVRKILNIMDIEAASAKAGQMFYLVINRGLVFVDEVFEADDGRTTTWVEAVAFSYDNLCSWHILDLATFEEDLPEGIRAKLE